MIGKSQFIISRHGPAAHRLELRQWNEVASSVTPVFCVHALTRVADDFEKLALALGNRAVYAPNLPGRGKSGGLLDSSLYSLPHYVKDCVQVLDALSLVRVDWVGTSLGGLIGMMVAAFYPGRIRRLVLNDVGPFLPQAGLRRIAAALALRPRFRHFDDALRYCKSAYGSFGIKDDESFRAFTKRSLADDGARLHFDPRIADNFAQAKGDIDLWRIYDLISCPVLVLRGESSDILLEADAHLMQRRGPRAELVTFSGCGHAPALESDEQIRVVEEFFR